MAEQSKDELLRIKISRGDTFNRIFNIIDLSGDVIDLTGWIARFTVKENITDSQEDAKIIKSSEDADEIDIFDPSNGRLRVYINHEDTQDLDPKTYYYDLQLEDPDDHIHTTHKSTFSVFADITTPPAI